MTDASARRWGAQSMTAPLREALVHRPGRAFGAAFEDPAHGATEIGTNGSGGPTCMTRPILRAD
jgi:arginine deiminase